MSKSDIVARQVALADLLDGIGEGKVVLPDFQRDFDWEPDEVIALVATVVSDWPAGSLLLMRGRPEFFRTRAFEHAPTQASSTEYVVLDGQQRLTALYHALRGRGPRVYALKCGELPDPTEVSIDEIEGAVFATDLEKWEATFDLSTQAERQVMPLYALSSAPDFFDWRDSVIAAGDPRQRTSLSEKLTGLYRNLLGNVNHYDFPSVVLNHDLESEAVARIFERINRTGQRLNTFDLLVARAYAPGWNLRDRWDEARRESDVLERFLGDDGLPILQLVALRDQEDVRQPALLKLRPEPIRDQWPGAVEAMEKAIAFCRDQGALDPGSLPYKAMLLTLGGVLWARPAADPGVLEHWFWGAAISGAYDSASSTRVVADYKALLRAIDAGEFLSAPPVSQEELVQATRRSRPAFWRTMCALLNRSNAVDLLTGSPLLDGGATYAPLFSGDEFADPPRRILGLVALSKSSARDVAGSSLIEAAERAAPEVLRSQYLPRPEDLRSWTRTPEHFMAQRLTFILMNLDGPAGQPVRMEVPGEAAARRAT